MCSLPCCDTTRVLRLPSDFALAEFSLEEDLIRLRRRENSHTAEVCEKAIVANDTRAYEAAEKSASAHRSYLRQSIRVAC